MTGHRPEEDMDKPVPGWAKLLVLVLGVLVGWVIVGLLVLAGMAVWGAIFS